MFRRGGQDGEVVRRTHIEDGLEIPDHLEGVTFDQKKRLARLAKMGLGPVAKPQERPRPGHGTLAVTGSTAGSLGTGSGGRGLSEAASSGGGGDAFNAHQQQQFERRASLLERERRLQKELQRQEEEDQKQREEEGKRKQERDKAARARGGLTSLGPVQPREEVAVPKPTLGYAFPAPTPSAAAGASSAGGGKMEVKLRASTVERVASSLADATELAMSVDTSQPRRFHEVEGADTESDAEDNMLANAQLARARAPSGPKAEKRLSADERKSKRKAKRKRRRPRSGGSSSAAPCSGDEHPGKLVSEEHFENGQERRLLSDATRQKARDGGISWNMMHVESVKGKVSNANKGFTDAELERRFGPREVGSASSLMTEEQVLAMMRRDKKGKTESDWAKRRAQRELAEWTSVKAQRMARTAEEKERLVVSGRSGSKIG